VSDKIWDEVKARHDTPPPSFPPPPTLDKINAKPVKGSKPKKIPTTTAMAVRG
jgi:hypothetical protein